MPNTLYTLGYTGNSIDHLKALVEQGAVILDIRMSPRSRVPQWNQGNLLRVLSSAYKWQPALGNRNYKNGGPIEISEPELGLWILKTSLSHKPVILLYACPNVETCHRKTVADMAISAGIVSTVRHLGPGERLEEVGNG
jgi:uncharacterized protein (DUF488 family)